MISKLPLEQNFQKNNQIIKKLIQAHQALGNLNGTSKIIPNHNILINALALQEAKDSSEIENIITTHDELYRSNVDKQYISQETKEVQNYKEALLYGFDIVKKNKIILANDIIKIQQILEKNDAGVRTQMGTSLKNDKTGETIFTPPQDPTEIKDLLSNLEKYINQNLDEQDPLIKMAIIHHQFESIHPFYDGNGRTGRIINILYLIMNDLLDLPILYLSGYIIKYKQDYYRLLQETRDYGKWEEWVLYMLDAVEKTSLETIQKVNGINDLMKKSKQNIKKDLPKIYSKDLIDILFSHPYTKIEFLVDGIGIHRETASKYLNDLVEYGFMKPIKIGRSKYFVNIELFEYLKKGYNF